MSSRSLWIAATTFGSMLACRTTISTSTPRADLPPVRPTASTTDPTPRPAVIPGDAVVRAGAKMYFAATGDAGASLPTGAGAPGFAVHVVEREGGRLLVEPLTALEHHCVGLLAGFVDLRVRLYVDEDALLPVLAEHYDHTFADGTGVRVSRGVPIIEKDVALARGTTVVAPFSTAQLGRSYAPAEPLPIDGGDRILATLPGHPLVYGGTTLDEADLHHHLGGVVRYGVVERNDHALVTVRNACIELTTRTSLERHRESTMLMTAVIGNGSRGAAPPSSPSAPEVASLTGTEIDPTSGAAFGSLDDRGLFGRPRKGHRVKVGAAISWPDGRAAGTVLREHRFDGEPRDEDGRRCFDEPLGADPTPSIALCFDTKDVWIPGTGFGGRGGTIPSVTPASAEVKGRLDRDIIRRIVRVHMDEIRACYTQGLVRDPKLQGKVAIVFTIGATGRVASASVGDITLADAAVGTCIATAILGWKFPKPTGDGTVTVTYPFSLVPG